MFEIWGKSSEKNLMLLLGFSKKVLLGYTFSNICRFFDFATFFNVGALAFWLWSIFVDAGYLSVEVKAFALVYFVELRMFVKRGVFSLFTYLYIFAF